jgi:hypothetical protein
MTFTLFVVSAGLERLEGDKSGPGAHAETETPVDAPREPLARSLHDRAKMVNDPGEGLEPALTEFLTGAAEHGRELARAEVDLARAEITNEIIQLKRGAVVLVVGICLLTCSLAVAVVAAVLALQVPPLSAVAGGLALVGLVVTLWGYRRVSGPVLRLPRTRQALAGNAAMVRGVSTTAESGAE